LAPAGEQSLTLNQPFLRARFTYLKTRSQKPAVPAINASMPAKWLQSFSGAVELVIGGCPPRGAQCSAASPVLRAPGTPGNFYLG
jgi:hypothetical protein